MILLFHLSDTASFHYFSTKGKPKTRCHRDFRESSIPVIVHLNRFQIFSFYSIWLLHATKHNVACFVILIIYLNSNLNFELLF